MILRQVADPIVSQVSLFACNFVPSGWMPCDGSLLSIEKNQALFSIIGASYGGDGKKTFAVPDLRTVLPVHAVNGIGQKTPSADTKGLGPGITLRTDQLPAHSHVGSFTGVASTGSASVAMVRKNETGSADLQEGDFLGKGGTGGSAATIYVRSSSTASEVKLANMSGSATVTPKGGVTVAPTGSGAVVVLPNIKMVWAICIVGVFPSRW